GDGRVVLIIDLLAHIRARQPALPAQVVDAPLVLNDPLKKRPLLVLVVENASVAVLESIDSDNSARYWLSESGDVVRESA
ncbi:hypothetical protein SB761_35485, partial [Pseudomonas sp. SIMBA_064]